MTLGAVLWGWAGSHIGIAPALLVASGTAAAAAIAVRGWGLDAVPTSEAPTVPMPRPEAPADELRAMLHGESGRVIEAVRYTIDPKRRAEFLAAMQEVRHVRRRSGAHGWQLLEDVAHPERWVELWSVESWTEHLREAGRLDPADRSVLARAAAFQATGAAPEAARYLGVQP